MSKSSCTPVPRAEMIACTSLFCMMRSIRAFSTLRILPRIGRIAWIRGSRPPLADDLPALGGVLFEPVAQLVVHHLLGERARLGVAQLGLGLALELRLGQLDRDDR